MSREILLLTQAEFEQMKPSVSGRKTEMDDAAAPFCWVENEWMLYCSWMDFDVMIKTVFNQYS